MEAGGRPVATGAQERFARLYEKLFDPVYWFCKKHLGSADGAAEDVAADVFTVVWRLIDRVPEPPEDRVFVYAIAYRQIRNQQRRLLRRTRLQRRLDGERAVLADDAAGEPDPSDAVRSALDALPAGEREALVLVVVDGFSHAEAARLLGCSANAVGLRLHRARARLRAQLEPGAAGGDGRQGMALYRGGFG